MQSKFKEESLFGNVDWGAVGVFLALLFMGWVNIYAAVYDDTHSSIFDIHQRYGMQMIWIAVSLVIGTMVLLIDDRYYHVLAYPVWIVSLLVLLSVSFLGKEVNGARSWIMIGPFALQPTEFMKFATALALARLMSEYSFNMKRLGSLLKVALVMLLPAAIILLQNDTGSALVYFAFSFMLYREGFNGWVYVVGFVLIALFVSSFLLNPITLLVLLLLFCVAAQGLADRRWREKIIFIATILLLTAVIYLSANMLFKTRVDIYTSLLVSAFAGVVASIALAYARRERSIYFFATLFVGALLLTFAVDYVFDNFMQLHQQKRILDLLGLEADLKGWGYNVNQSKIAIGSGGFFGKGFLNGTQTRYNFVPEQSTDFIFCTIGEEWGFIGSVIVVVLFAMLILKLMKMGERQHEPFGRIYCYSVASIFLCHVFINIGMTIGVVPVIGIPLPFFSYGGSSLIAFTILFMVAVKMDAKKLN